MSKREAHIAECIHGTIRPNRADPQTNSSPTITSSGQIVWTVRDLIFSEERKRATAIKRELDKDTIKK